MNGKRLEEPFIDQFLIIPFSCQGYSNYCLVLRQGKDVARQSSSWSARERRGASIVLLVGKGKTWRVNRPPGRQGKDVARQSSSWSARERRRRNVLMNEIAEGPITPDISMKNRRSVSKMSVMSTSCAINLRL